MTPSSSVELASAPPTTQLAGSGALAPAASSSKSAHPPRVAARMLPGGSLQKDGMFRARQPSATARGPLALLARGRPTSAGPPAEGTRARAGPGLLVRPPATPRGRGARAPCGGKCPAAGRAAIFPRTARAKNNNNGARSEMRPRNPRPERITTGEMHGDSAQMRNRTECICRMHACVLSSPHSLPPLTCEVIGVRGTRIFDTRGRPRGVDRRTRGRERASGPSTRRRCLGAGASPRTITVRPARGLRPVQGVP